MNLSPLGMVRASASVSPFALGLATVLAAASTVQAQFDVNVFGLEVNQAFQTDDDDSPLVAGRSTFVRTKMRVLNPPFSPLPLDGVLRVFVDGVAAPFSPVFSDNGPFPAPQVSNLTILDGTLNFIFVAPHSDNVVITVEINGPGPNAVPEANLVNNTYSTPALSFEARERAEIAYSPIDYRPTGGSVPNPPDPVLIEPGSGDNFVQAIYPTHDWFYHRTDAPSKLWTQSLAGSGTGLLSSLSADIVLMNPVPNILYGWVPGGLSYNGVSMVNSPVSMGNTQSFKFQRTFAHEMGHNFGLFHNGSQSGRPNVDVENHLAITENLPIVKGQNLNDIMVAGLNTNQAWIRGSNYAYFFNHPILDPGAPSPLLSNAALFLSGTWNTESGLIDVAHMFDLTVADLPSSSPTGVAQLVARVYTDGELQSEHPVTQVSLQDSCAGEQHEHAADSASAHSPLVSFELRIPQGSSPIETLVLAPVDGANAQPLVLTRSANAPSVAFTSPAPQAQDAQPQTVPGRLTVTWQGVDADGDTLRYYLRYSHDGFRFAPLATGIRETSLEVDLTQLPALVNGQGFFELLATDGLNTTVARTSVLAGSFFGPGGNAPWVEVMTPDNGKSYLRGATVILHSSGWDLEDRGLTGASIQWFSDIEGPIASGRMGSIATLSPGTHVITVEATDSGGLVDSDTSTITIVDRGLPETGGDFSAYCTAKLSTVGCLAQVGASGTPSLSDPAAFDINASDVNNNKNGLVFYGLSAGNLPFLGGTLCVTPPIRRTAVQNSAGNAGPDDCSGGFTFDFNALIQSGSEPLLSLGTDIFTQYWYRDPADLANSAALSNAFSFTIQP